MADINPADLDLPELIKDLIQTGIFACCAGFTVSAYELFEQLHKAFPDAEAPLIAMVFAKLMEGQIKQSEEIFATKLKGVEDQSEAVLVMKVFIETFRDHGVGALKIMQDLQSSNDNLTKKTINRILKTMGRLDGQTS